MKVRWTESARNDLRSLRDYIARDSAVYARRMVDRIKASVTQLASFPELGGKVEEWDREDIRELLEGNYRIIYLVEARKITILTIIHAARQLPKHPND
jgi:plasmid stabilization system protein ParE